jgi:hypothetical protein
VGPEETFQAGLPPKSRQCERHTEGGKSHRRNAQLSLFMNTGEARAVEVRRPLACKRNSRECESLGNIGMIQFPRLDPMLRDWYRTDNDKQSDKQRDK